ncbi:MAG TPA: zinc ribbon domain-containing protein [Candidatus Sulfotelmatobacter sp.]|nr:zinc ribbon domain-containing protein [Candidatus Sulfotelmatobacter sp.]
MSRPDDNGFNDHLDGLNTDRPDTDRPKSDRPSTLPSPELNPLTNPVLGRNMGRWAEVYFTNPPEKREQAVQALLRELERDSAAGEIPVEPGTDELGTDGAEDRARYAAMSGQGRRLREGAVECPGCGREALAEQKFCGTCGAPLPVRQSVAHLDLGNETRRAASSTSELDGLRPADRAARFGEEEFEEEKAAALLSALLAPSIGDNGLNRGAHPPIAGETPRLFMDHRQAGRRRSRLLMSGALAILLGTFLYVAGRETAAWMRARHGLPQTASVESRAATTQPSAPGQAVKSADRVSASDDHASSPSQTGISANRQDAKKNAADEKPSASVSSSQPVMATPVIDEKSNQAAGGQGAGAEELAVAESYLSGAPGKPRDSSAAAEWLWKSVAKQNAEATLLLSDLYVRGDGVPQNCDQARLLLDAAARKGAAGAGERIRNLPNVGCQ